MYGQNWNTLSNPYQQHGDKVRTRVRNAIYRTLPCYRYFNNKKLKKYATTPIENFDGAGTILFPDGRMFIIETTPKGILIKRDFLAPTKTAPLFPFLQISGLVKWEDIPYQTAHDAFERLKHKTNPTVYFVKDFSGHLHIPTKHYSLYLIWLVGGDIGIHFTKKETSTLGIPTQPGLAWEWDANTLNTVKEWYKTHHPKLFTYWELTSLFSFLPNPLISPTPIQHKGKIS